LSSHRRLTGISNGTTRTRTNSDTFRITRHSCLNWRKSGGGSRIAKDDFDKWFQQIWNITGVSTKQHPAPFPLELATRLVRMFSFIGDTVLDPFCGSGTTMVAALRTDRNSIGVDIDPEYCRMAARYLKAENSDLFSTAKLLFKKVAAEPASLVKEDRALYEVRPAKKRLE
jgi:DNA modification methylase